MKKTIIIAALVALILPYSSYAVTIIPGDGGTLNCIPWNQNITPADAATYQGQPVCGKGDDTTKRIYNLELAVQGLTQTVGQLQSQVSSLKAQNAPQQAVAAAVPQSAQPSLEPRVASLEKRTSALESAVAYLQTTVTASINKVITLIQQLLKK